MKYDKYKNYLKFIKDYSKASNAATGSKFDANANVESKNVATLSTEMHKETNIGINRLQMFNKIHKMWGEDLAYEYIRQLENHEIYRCDETHPRLPYCAAISLYPFLIDGLKSLGGPSTAPTNLDSFCGGFVNLIFAISSQFCGAIASPELLPYLDHFIRKEYGDDYLSRIDEITNPLSSRKRTLQQKIEDYFEQIVYSINEPAAARNYQSVFWNVSYFDRGYFDAIFKDFVFPDGDEPKWETTQWLQKCFMKWFNKERTRNYLTFPVETVNLLYDEITKEYKDKEFADFVAEMWAEGHSFFCYNSDSADSLSSCCFSKDTMTLTKSSNGVNIMSFEDLYKSVYRDTKRNFTIFHNGSWVKGKIIKLKNRSMYKITTANNKEIIISDNHLNPCIRGDIKTTELTCDDYLLFSTRELDSYPEKDEHLTYEEGFVVGAFLGDGSFGSEINGEPREVNFSQNITKYKKCMEMIDSANKQLGGTLVSRLSETYNNVYPVRISSPELAKLIIKWTNWKRGTYAFNKELNMNCLLQSVEFRKGILDGWYNTDGGNSNRCYTSSPKLAHCMEILITSLGMSSIININDRTDLPVIIRGEQYTRNYPLYCVRWYDMKNKRSMANVYKVKNNSIYFKIKSIEQVDYKDDIYCFEISNKEEPYFTLPNGIITHNCRLRSGLEDSVFSYTLGAGGISTGSKAVITININRLVQDAKRNNEDLDTKIREQVRKIHKYLLAFNSILEEQLKDGLMPVYDAGYISLERQYLTVGINGCVEGAEFLGIEVSDNVEYKEYCKSILKPIMEENKIARKEYGWLTNTEFVPAENLGVKNAHWDKKDGYFVPRDCYNSYFFKVEDDSLSIIDKMNMHGKEMTKYLDGGSACHINLEEHLDKEQYRKLLDYAAKVGCSYFTFNIPNMVCNDCDYISKHYLKKCPKCGSTNLDYITRVIGYAKRVSNYSEARQEEEHKRFYGKC